MKVKIVTRFGKVVEFERKKKVFNQRPGEKFESALFRCYYPAEYAAREKARAA